MTSHEEWFRDLREPDRPDYVEAGDDTTHSIRHIGNVSFGKEGNQSYIMIKNVLNVPPSLKIVEQGMQVQFDQGGQLIAHGRREGQMFILDSHEMKSAMFA